MGRHSHRLLISSPLIRLAGTATTIVASLAVFTCVAVLIGLAGCQPCDTDVCEKVGDNYGGGTLQLSALPYTGDPLELTVEGVSQEELDEAVAEYRPFRPCELGGDQHAHLLVDENERWLRACGRPLTATLGAPCADFTDHLYLSLKTDPGLVGVGAVALADVGELDFYLSKGSDETVHVSALDSEAEIEWTSETSGRLWIPDATLRESECNGALGWQEYGQGEVEITWSLDATVTADACATLLCM